MANEPDDRKLYGEKEISALLKRAAALQASDPDSDRPGLSLKELEQIAAEAGIDPRFVRAAAADAGRGAPSDIAGGLLGGPLTIEDERIFHGEVTPDQWETMVQEIRRTFGQGGTASQVGHSLEWNGEQRRHFRQPFVTVSPRNGRTRVQITQRQGKGAFLFYYLAGWIAAGAAGITLSALHMAPAAEAAIVGSGVLAYGALLRLAFGQWTREQKHHIKILMDRLEAIAGGSSESVDTSTASPTGAADPAPVPSGGHIQLPDEPAPEPQPDAPVRDRTRT
ncbi:MAG TPA: hypothetical protein VFG50_09085 [Rhodothermales bacterium]|nr:hypothetical protein [Rhodothermales bacterium]